MESAVTDSMWISTMNVSMLDQVAVGGGASLVNLVIHAILMGAIVSHRAATWRIRTRHFPASRNTRW